MNRTMAAALASLALIASACSTGPRSAQEAIDFDELELSVEVTQTRATDGPWYGEDLETCAEDGAELSFSTVIICLRVGT